MEQTFLKKELNLIDNLDKLPKWAQSDIQILQRRLKEAHNEIKRRDENTPSNTIVGWNSKAHDEQIVYLRNNQTITFLVKNGEIRIRVDDDHLDVNSSGGDILSVSPRASNSLYISLPKIEK